MTLQLVSPKRYNDGKYVTKYENSNYKVFLVEEDDFLQVNTIREDFHSPNIEHFGGELTVNIPAKGALNTAEAIKFMNEVTFALATIEEIKELMSKYKYNEDLDALEEA